MSKSGDLFEQEFETWTPVQAKSFFRAGMVDDFFVTNINDVYWVLTLKVVGREGRQMFVQMRGAREVDRSKVRQFRTLDAAVRAAGEIGFDVRSIGIARLGHKSLERGVKAFANTARELRQMLPKAD
ncbi:hypothetical protein [Paraburkholderia sp. BL10I2N1]|uniref:hypothetical protein n=1 Tax=Paraburkholderia sp. BL10I2N1 TaxID=1938796 RepID=UPI00105DE55B|nr:hypothetical protein [Paraburkholderia sp. BL10I2N1]